MTYIISKLTERFFVRVLRVLEVIFQEHLGVFTNETFNFTDRSNSRLQIVKRKTFCGSRSWMSSLNLLTRGEKFIQVVTRTNSTVKYRKIPKISPGTDIFQRPFLRGLFLEVLIFGRGLCTEANLRFKIDWASL